MAVAAMKDVVVNQEVRGAVLHRAAGKSLRLSRSFLFLLLLVVLTAFTLLNILLIVRCYQEGTYSLSDDSLCIPFLHATGLIPDIIHEYVSAGTEPEAAGTEDYRNTPPSGALTGSYDWGSEFGWTGGSTGQTTARSREHFPGLLRKEGDRNEVVEPAKHWIKGLQREDGEDAKLEDSTKEGSVQSAPLLQYSGGRSAFFGVDPMAKLYYHRVREDGFNNQLLSVYLGVKMALDCNATYILPELFEDFQIGRRNRNRHFPFEDYFDVGLLSKLVPVMSFADFRRRCSPEGAASRIIGLVPRMEAGRGAARPHRNEQVLGLRYGGTHMFDSADDLCATVRSHTSGVCFALASTYTHLEDNGGLGTYHQVHRYRGYDVHTSPYFHQIRSHVQARPIFWQAAHALIKSWAEMGRKVEGEEGGDHSMAAIHVRRGDYLRQGHCLRWWKFAKNKAEVCPSDDDVCVCVSHLLKGRQEIRTLVVMTNIDKATDFQEGLSACLHDMGITKVHVTSVRESVRRHPPAGELGEMLAAGRVDVLGLLEQTVGMSVDFFIGNSFSSWSWSVFQQREIENRPILRWGNCTLTEGFMNLTH